MKTPAPQSIAHCNLLDCTEALSTSFVYLSEAAENAQNLLRLAGVAGARGDTADDLVKALAIHRHLLQQFDVKIRTSTSADVCTVTARTSQGAYAATAERLGDEPFGISVTRATNVDLAIAHRKLQITGSLKDAMNNPALSTAIQSYARRKARRNKFIDFKSLAANDRD